MARTMKYGFAPAGGWPGRGSDKMRGPFKDAEKAVSFGRSTFAKFSTATRRAVHDSWIRKGVSRAFQGHESSWIVRAGASLSKWPGGINKGLEGPARLAGRLLGHRRLGILGLAVGAIAMVGVGIMRGVNNASQDIVAQRYIQDQRYARNITMMSRLGYSSGTSQMNNYNHTDGLALSLSSNRHGRGKF